MKKKRSQLDIIRDMLDSIQAKGGRIKPTHLLYKSNLSYKMMQEYLDMLKERGLVVEEASKRDEEKRELVITDKGLQFLFEYKRMAEFTDAFGL
jgi:predicted transcriptional regulator